VTDPIHTGLPRRRSTDSTGDAARVLAKLEAAGNDLTILRLVANDPTMLRPFAKFSSMLLNDATLPSDVREAVILWIAQRSRNTYEWAEHEIMAPRYGLAPDQIEGLRRGDTSGLSAAGRQAIEFAAELLESGRVSAPTWQAATDAWGVEGTIDLVLSIGMWNGLVPTVIAAFGLQVPDDQQGRPLPSFD
jgi:alkylhydroperoxidase family enzyme